MSQRWEKPKEDRSWHAGRFEWGFSSHKRNSRVKP